MNVFQAERTEMKKGAIEQKKEEVPEEPDDPTELLEIIEKMGIRDQNDPKLEEATKEIYKAGFHTGRINDNCGEFAGLPVA